MAMAYRRHHTPKQETPRATRAGKHASAPRCRIRGRIGRGSKNQGIREERPESFTPLQPASTQCADSCISIKRRNKTSPAHPAVSTPQHHA